MFLITASYNSAFCSIFKKEKCGRSILKVFCFVDVIKTACHITLGGLWLLLQTDSNSPSHVCHCCRVLGLNPPQPYLVWKKVAQNVSKYELHPCLLSLELAVVWFLWYYTLVLWAVYWCQRSYHFHFPSCGLLAEIET